MVGGLMKTLKKTANVCEEKIDVSKKHQESERSFWLPVRVLPWFYFIGSHFHRSSFPFLQLYWIDLPSPVITGCQTVS